MAEVRIFDNLEQLAQHKRSYERGVIVEDPKHYEGLIAEKKRAQSSKLKEQFLGLGEPAKSYYEGLAGAELNLHYHISLLMGFVRLYGKTEVLQAVDYALRHKAFAASYVKNIIFQQRCSRGIKENMPISIPAKPIWTQICVEDQDLSLYDDLCADSIELPEQKITAINEDSNE